jgi:hypothetical protein
VSRTSYSLMMLGWSRRFMISTSRVILQYIPSHPNPKVRHTALRPCPRHWYTKPRVQEMLVPAVYAGCYAAFKATEPIRLHAYRVSHSGATVFLSMSFTATLIPVAICVARTTCGAGAADPHPRHITLLTHHAKNEALTKQPQQLAVSIHALRASSGCSGSLLTFADWPAPRGRPMV